MSDKMRYVPGTAVTRPRMEETLSLNTSYRNLNVWKNDWIRTGVSE